MTSPRNSRLTLEIPDMVANPASPSGASVGSATQTGRPSLWKTSAQRKMARLYVYTTLPLQKILDVVYGTSSLEAAPGKDSANKKLNMMLDKEPRWLHPRTESDMSRRVTELARSPARSPVVTEPHFGRRHALSDPSPLQHPFGTFKTEAGASPAARDIPRFGNWSASPPDSTAHDFGMPNPGLGIPHWDSQAPRGSTAPPSGSQNPSNDHFATFLRRTSVLTSSTDHTTGSFHRILPEYSDAYVQTVRKLVKRFTLPSNHRMSMSPITERPLGSWVDDTPSHYSVEPFPLSGDFLVPSNFGLDHQECTDQSGRHLSQTCSCFIIEAMSGSPWINAYGTTRDGERIVRGGIGMQDIAVRDPFGNTALHLMAAHGSYKLIEALQSGLVQPILNTQNSAGQTFLHVLSQAWIFHSGHLAFLLSLLRQMNFDIYAQDHYGRNFFHILQHLQVDLSTVLADYEQARYARRDAFNRVPLPQSPVGSTAHPFSSHDAMDIDVSHMDSAHEANPHQSDDFEVERETALIQHVRMAEDNPSHHDENGGNGLHCLAMASLSIANVSSKASPGARASLSQNTTPERPKTKSSEASRNLDSSSERLEFRFRIVQNLVEAGVDVNAYDNDGNTPLMAFAAQLPEEDDYRTGPKILQFLIRNGANPNARNRAGETALHIAVRCGRKLAVRTLAKENANVHVRDASGRSLLDVADFKTASSNTEVPKEYSHFEACRAWLSGQAGAVQCPTVLQEWSAGRQR
ncbi:hypothetical protein B0I35DRAFT_477397 [Stachybotrys elegans]|uniref:Uncharacterized protein n=1 Tax=Stachybotrys elegans TaxID=80388 RepID=A0A8K0WS33_9HYPO|nr:hypothetical protein B0I35DRAFT_477397 [Stachybotrys elegans]